MLEIWVTADSLKDILHHTIGEEVDEEDLLKYLPPVMCADADIYGFIEANGSLSFSADYNSELMTIEEDDEE